MASGARILRPGFFRLSLMRSKFFWKTGCGEVLNCTVVLILKYIISPFQFSESSSTPCKNSSPVTFDECRFSTICSPMLALTSASSYSWLIRSRINPALVNWNQVSRGTKSVNETSLVDLSPLCKVRYDFYLLLFFLRKLCFNIKTRIDPTSSPKKSMR